MIVKNIGTGTISAGANTSFITIPKGGTATLTDAQWDVLKESHFKDSLEIVEKEEQPKTIKLSGDSLIVERI